MSERTRPALGRRIATVLHSIRFRLVLWYTVILAVVLAVFSGFIYVNQSRDILGESEYRLERKMATLEVTLTPTSSGLLVPPGVLQDTDVLVFLDANGQVLASHGPIPAEQAVQLASQAQQEREQNYGSPDGYVSWTGGRGPGQPNYLFVTVPFLDGSGGRGLAILGSPADPFGLTNRLILTLAAGSLLTLLVALLGGYWLADRAMRPVHTITQAARTIGETDLNRRLNLKSRDELGELANTFDGMLDRLQAAFERQRQFVADASHELRTPLTIVNLEAGRALSARRSADDYQHALTVIRSENDFMTGLVNDMLMLARMDAGQASMEKKRLDLSDVALETVERLAPLAARKDVTLEAGELPEVPVLGDRKYLIQMITNLVENGIKYTAGEAKKVCVETGSQDGQVWLTVSDNGPGIPAEYQPKLFDRFFRADQARARADDPQTGAASPNGSGLGLAIVKWIVETHGGTIAVRSQLGSGTTFEVRFPAA